MAQKIQIVEVDQDHALALEMLRVLADAVGNTETMELDMERVHRILLALRAMLIEADQSLKCSADFGRVASGLAVLIADEVAFARDFRVRNGVGLAEIALQNGSSVN